MATWLAFKDKAFRLDYESCFYGIAHGEKGNCQYESFERVGACIDRMSELAMFRVPFEVTELMNGDPKDIGRTVLDDGEYYGDVKLYNKELVWKTHKEEMVVDKDEEIMES